MTLLFRKYDQTKVSEVEHKSTVQTSITSKNRH